jgi:Tol biopolymer transport system component
VNRYYLRIAITSLALLLLTIGLFVLVPPEQGPRVVAQGPSGDAVSANTSIQATFDRAVDRRSVERSLTIEPPVPGVARWQGQALTFDPTGPLLPATTYTVTLAAGLRDEQGRATSEPLRWSFRTRAPQLAYLAGPLGQATSIVVAAGDGSSPRTVAELPAGVSALSVAPDGINLIYAQQRTPQRTALYVTDLSSGAQRPLVDDEAASVTNAAWSPDGNLIAYERRGFVVQTGAVGPPQLWLAQPDGTALGPVDGGEAVNFAPAWSPDSSRLAFVDGNAEEQAVYDFASRRNAFSNSAGEKASWSPDGQSLAYTGFRSPEDRLPLLWRGTIGGEGVPLDGTEGGSSPAWSPDGSQIAFARSEGGPAKALWVMPADGGEPRRLTSPGDAQDLLPVWSPDSQSLIFTRVTGGAGGVASSVRLVDLNGDERLLADDASGAVWVP